MKRNFVYSTFLAVALFISGCEMDTFNEQDAINAQKEIMNSKNQNALELEKLRISAATAMEQLRFTNALAELRLNDELTKGAALAVEAARQANALALESARQANALALQKDATAAAIAAANAKAATDAAAAAKAAEVAENARLAPNRRDYTVTVTDINTGVPIPDADVMVASEGKIVTVKTNAAGIATFSGLTLFPMSRFTISKAGFTTGSISQEMLLAANTQPVGLFNTADAKNEVKGKLFIETDLTNATSEIVPGNTLVTATANVSNNMGGSYRVQVATRTDAAGNYSLKLPDAPNSIYSLTFGQVTADQKLYVNGTEDAGANFGGVFPTVLPQIATIKTFFDVNNSIGFPQPNALNRFYYRLPADLDGDIAYFNASQTETSQIGSTSEFRITKLSYGPNNFGGPFLPAGNKGLKFAPNAVLDVVLVDWTGKYVKDAPKLVAYSDANGNLINTPEVTDAATGAESFGFLTFKRSTATAANPTAGELVAGAQGVFKMDDEMLPNVLPSGFSTFNFKAPTPNTTTNTTVTVNGGQTVVRNFDYGTGSSREKAVF